MALGPITTIPKVHQTYNDLRTPWPILVLIHVPTMAVPYALRPQRNSKDTNARDTGSRHLTLLSRARVLLFLTTCPAPVQRTAIAKPGHTNANASIRLPENLATRYFLDHTTSQDTRTRYTMHENKRCDASYVQRRRHSREMMRLQGTCVSCILKSIFRGRPKEGVVIRQCSSLTLGRG